MREGDRVVDINFWLYWQRQLEAYTRAFLDFLPTLLLGLLVGLLFWWLARWVRGRLQALFAQRDWPQEIELLLGRAISLAIMLLGIVSVLGIWGVDVRGLIAGLGVAGVAVAFAAQQILQNLFAGVLILLQRPFSIGDQIAVGDQEGEVEEVTLRATVLRTADHRQVAIPNATIIGATITNLTHYPARRSEVTVVVGPDESVAAARARLLAVAREVPGVLATPEPTAIVTERSADEATLTLRYWTASARAQEVQTRAALLEALAEAQRAAARVPTPREA